MRQLYSLFMVLLTPILLLRLCWKSKGLPAYRQRIAERFALKPLKTADLWLHAVSLGEVVAATPLIEAFLEKGWQVLVTTMTPTGSERLQKHFGLRIAHQYIPYDIPWLMQRFYRQVQPRMALIMETELWPNMIHFAAAAKIPLYLLNARLSDRSLRQYQKVAFFFHPLLEKFSGIFAQSQEDARRFIALGAAEKCLQALGNLKFDGQMQASCAEKLSPLKKRWSEARSVFIAASTHNDEEAQILSTLKALQAAIPDILLVIAPRHPERFQEVFQLSLNAGFNTQLRSKEEALSPEMQVLVLDSLGELSGFYSLCDYAFVGGSLIPVGGHNVLEPVAAGIPVFTGMHMQNSKSICQDLLAAKAMQMLSNADALIEALIQLHQNPLLKKNQVANATKILNANQGVVQRYLKTLNLEGFRR